MYSWCYAKIYIYVQTYIYSVYQFDTVLQTVACIHYMYIIKFSFQRYSLKSTNVSVEKGINTTPLIKVIDLGYK